MPPKITVSNESKVETITKIIFDPNDVTEIEISGELSSNGNDGIQIWVRSHSSTIGPITTNGAETIAAELFKTVRRMRLAKLGSIGAMEEKEQDKSESLAGIVEGAD